MLYRRGASREPVVVVAGHVTHDRTPAGTVPGGPAYYAVHTHRGLGAAARLVTAVGNDFACDDAIAGAPAEVRRGGATTELGPGARLIARAQAVLAVDLPESWRRCDLLHLAPVLGEVDLARWVQVAGARLVAIGVHGFTRIPGPNGTIATRRWNVDRRALAGVDAACVGEDDLADQGDLLDRLIESVPIVAVTRGARGADVIVRGRTVRIGVHPVRLVDPTGAGATFAPALFYALARGFTPVEAGQLAAAAASIVLEGSRGTCMPRIAEAWTRSNHVPAERWAEPALRLTP